MSPSLQPKKERRNVSLPPELDSWLRSDDVENASELITELLKAYRAYGDLDSAARYVRDKNRRTSNER